MANHEELTVGVIGGLGPDATHDFFGKLLRHSKASSDQEHLHVIIENNPKTPNRNEAIAGTGPSCAPALAAMGKVLEEAGAGFIVMACNTAHAFEDDIVAAINTPFVSLITEVTNEIGRSFPNTSKVGLLAAKGCIDSKIYDRAFSSCGIEVLHLDGLEHAAFMALLYRIKAGERSSEASTQMQALGESLVAKGADVLIAACTEVPLVLQDGMNSRPLLDSTDVLAQRCVIYARRHEALPSKMGLK